MRRPPARIWLLRARCRSAHWWVYRPVALRCGGSPVIEFGTHPSQALAYSASRMAKNNTHMIKSYYLSAPNSERNDQIIAKHCQSFKRSVWAGLIAPTRDLFTYPLNSFASHGFTSLAYGRPVIVFSTVHLLSLQKNHPTSTRHYWLAAKDRMPPPQPPGSPLLRSILRSL